MNQDEFKNMTDDRLLEITKSRYPFDPEHIGAAKEQNRRQKKKDRYITILTLFFAAIAAITGILSLLVKK